MYYITCYFKHCLIFPGTSGLIKNGDDEDDDAEINVSCLEVDDGASVSPNHVV